MSVQVEKLEKNMAKLTIEASAEDFEKACNQAYQKSRKKIQIPGFRKGKAPRVMIEKMYGEGIFYEDAANELIPDAYDEAVKEVDLEIVSQPEIDVEQIEKGKPFIFTATVAVKPEVTLGDYKGIEVEKKSIEVTEEEVKEEIDKVRDQNGRTITVEGRAVENGDTAVIDFEGYVDGETFEGGSGEDFALVIGSHSFIDTFEEQLIGKNAGDETEVNVTFPEDYNAAELAGKEAMFKVSVKEIKCKELPELDDEYVQDISDCETVDAYKEQVRDGLKTKKEKEARAAKEDVVIAKIIENSEMEVPEPMLDFQARHMAQDFVQRLQYQGMSVEQYFGLTGLDADRLVEQMKPQALVNIQSRLVLEAVANAENLGATDEEVEKELGKMAEQYHMDIEKARNLFDDEQKKNMKADIAIQKAVDFVIDAAVEK